MPINQDLLFNIKFNSFRETELLLDEEKLTDEDIIELVEALKFNNYVKQLSLESNYISTIGAQSLATLPRLEVLNVCGNKIGSQGAISLSKSNLYKLDIGCNPIKDDIAVFASMPSLIELHAIGCNITDIGAGQLLLSESIKKLTLQMNRFTGKFLENIISNTVLEKLDLIENHIQGEYCRYIAQNNTLKVLSLGGNFIRDEGAVLLAENCSLEELNLSQCFIKDKGAIALSQNKSLKILRLFNNYITGIGAKAFVNNTTLTYLSLASNPFDLEKTKNLYKYYDKNRDKVFIRTQENIETLFKKKLNENSTMNNIPVTSIETLQLTQSLELLPLSTSAPELYLENEANQDSKKEKRKIEENKFLNQRSSKRGKFFSE